jgi:hypothetical protein
MRDNSANTHCIAVIQPTLPPKSSSRSLSRIAVDFSICLNKMTSHLIALCSEITPSDARTFSRWFVRLSERGLSIVEMRLEVAEGGEDDGVVNNGCRWGRACSGSEVVVEQ